MSDHLYVAVDAHGVEHAASGDIQWALPKNGQFQVTESTTPLVLRQPDALLDVLDERIYTAQAVAGTVSSAPDGTAHAATASLETETPWNTETATRFAIECADHVLGDARDVVFADGTTCASILADARHALEDLDEEAASHLSLLARLSAFRRLAREREDLSGLSRTLAFQDGNKDVEVDDDPAYSTLVPVTDAVLAAIEAVRHHLLPHPFMAIEDEREEHEAHHTEDRTTEIHPPVLVVTPFGAADFGRHVLRYEPAWTSAREAARHARAAARDRSGPDGEEAERTWQAATLAAVLQPN